MNRYAKETGDWSSHARLIVPRVPYAFEAFHRSINCVIPDYKRMYAQCAAAFMRETIATRKE